MTPLNRNEMEAMRILWERSECKPAEIQEQFSWHIDNGTLRSTLVNLVRKKHVTRSQQGKAFYYAARLPKATALQTIMRGVARVFAKGSTRDLVAQLVDSDDFTPEDLKVLRDIVSGKPLGKQK